MTLVERMITHQSRIARGSLPGSMRFTFCLIISLALIFRAWLHELCAWPGCKLRAAVGWQHLMNDEAGFHGPFPRRSEELAVRADWLSSLLFFICAQVRVEATKY